jgi:DNA-binding NarL/FixJ family response regulator
MKTAARLAHSKIRILLADDEPIFREGARKWIELQPDMACCAESANAASTEQAVAQEHPDLVILELRLERDDGFDLINRLHAAYPALRLLVMSRNDEMVFGDRVLRAGAHGYIMKNQTGPDLIAAIRSVMGGEVHLGKKLAASIIKKLWHKGAHSGDPTVRLSDRELQIFRFLGQGQSTRHIAEHLKLGVKTVETHREHIKRKLELKDAPSLVHAATRWVEGRPGP